LISEYLIKIKININLQISFIIVIIHDIAARKDAKLLSS
jgi:hypothetical protein